MEHVVDTFIFCERLDVSQFQFTINSIRFCQWSDKKTKMIGFVLTKFVIPFRRIQTWVFFYWKCNRLQHWVNPFAKHRNICINSRVFSASATDSPWNYTWKRWKEMTWWFQRKDIFLVFFRVHIQTLFTQYFSSDIGYVSDTYSTWIRFWISKFGSFSCNYLPINKPFCWSGPPESPCEQFPNQTLKFNDWIKQLNGIILLDRHHDHPL